MVCLPATIQSFKMATPFDLGPSCSLFIRRIAAESRLFVVPALRHAVRRVKRGGGSLLLIKTKASTITASSGLKPRYLISQTYLSTRGDERQQRDKCGDENPKKSDTSGTLGLFSTSCPGMFVRIGAVGCKCGLLSSRAIMHPPLDLHSLARQF